MFWNEETIFRLEHSNSVGSDEMCINDKFAR